MTVPARIAFLVIGLFVSVVAPATPVGSAAPALEALSHLRCSNADALKARYSQRFAEPMRTWSQRELADLKGRSVLYPFSGPDAVTALALFPEAAHLTLVADQRPEYALLAAPMEDAPGAIERECRMLSFFSQLGYYRTHDLNGRGGDRPRFIQLLAYSIAFGGASVIDASLVSINAKGDLESFPAGTDRPADGVRFLAKRQDGREVTVDYLVINLSNRGLSGQNPAVLFLKQRASDVLFLKAASHLLQSGSFSTLAGILTNPAAPFVVQDETGLGVDRLQANYTLTLYGHYTAPQKLWSQNSGARAFSDLYAHQTSLGSLPFVFGYEKSAGSALIVGRRH
jgi:hypothetical protein